MGRKAKERFLVTSCQRCPLALYCMNSVRCFPADMCRQLQTTDIMKCRDCGVVALYRRYNWSVGTNFELGPNCKLVYGMFTCEDCHNKKMQKELEDGKIP